MHSDLLVCKDILNWGKSPARAYGRNISSISVSFTECQKEDIVVILLASGLVPALMGLVMLGVLNRTPRDALRKAACRADGL